MSVSDDGSPGPSRCLDTVSYTLTLRTLFVYIYNRLRTHSDGRLCILRRIVRPYIYMPKWSEYVWDACISTRQIDAATLMPHTSRALAKFMAHDCRLPMTVILSR